MTYAGEFERSKKGRIFTSDSTGISLQDVLRVWSASLDQADGRSKSANLLIYLDSCFSGAWATQLAKKKHWYDFHWFMQCSQIKVLTITWLGRVKCSRPSGPLTSYMVTLSPTQPAPSIYEEEVPLE